MRVAFKSPEQSGWRGRGAPRRRVSDDVLTVLKRAAESGKDGVLTVEDETPAQVQEAMAELRAGARQLGLRIRIQTDDEGETIRIRIGGNL